MIVAGMATMPDRLPYLKNVVEALRPQVDVLRVYLNNFVEPPSFLSAAESCLSAEAAGDLGAEGKFYWVDGHDGTESDHYLTVDDDLGYPPDYVARLLEESEARGDRAVVGVHGSRFALPIEDFVTSRAVRYRFYEDLVAPEAVHMLGTGTTLIPRAAIRLSMDDFAMRNASDLQLAIAAQRQGTPMVAVAREEAWVKEVRPWTAEGYSIWKATKAEGKRQAKTDLARTAVERWQLHPDPILTPAS